MADEAGSLRSAYRRQLQLIASLRQQLSDLDLGNGDDDEELRELEVRDATCTGRNSYNLLKRFD